MRLGVYGEHGKVACTYDLDRTLISCKLHFRTRCLEAGISMTRSVITKTVGIKGSRYINTSASRISIKRLHRSERMQHKKNQIRPTVTTLERYI